LENIFNEEHPKHGAKDDDFLTQKEKLEFIASIQLSPNHKTQEDDASLQLLLKSTGNQKDNTEALVVDCKKRGGGKDRR
jgi:hypothetical protein